MASGKTSRPHTAVHSTLLNVIYLDLRDIISADLMASGGNQRYRFFVATGGIHSLRVFLRVRMVNNTCAKHTVSGQTSTCI